MYNIEMNIQWKKCGHQDHKNTPSAFIPAPPPKYFCFLVSFTCGSFSFWFVCLGFVFYPSCPLLHQKWSIWHAATKPGAFYKFLVPEPFQVALMEVMSSHSLSPVCLPNMLPLPVPSQTECWFWGVAEFQQCISPTQECALCAVLGVFWLKNYLIKETNLTPALI